MRSLKALFAGSLMLACADSNPVLEPTPLDLNGEWTFEQLVANQTEAVACAVRGSIDFTHTESDLTGVLDLDQSECVYLIDGGAPGGPEFGTATVDFGPVLNAAPITDGSITMESVRCAYDGAIAGSAPTAIGGGVSCLLSIEGEYDNVTVAGEWSAVR